MVVRFVQYDVNFYNVNAFIMLMMRFHYASKWIYVDSSCVQFAPDIHIYFCDDRGISTEYMVIGEQWGNACGRGGFSKMNAFGCFIWFFLRRWSFRSCRFANDGFAKMNVFGLFREKVFLPANASWRMWPDYSVSEIFVFWNDGFAKMNVLWLFREDLFFARKCVVVDGAGLGRQCYIWFGGDGFAKMNVLGCFARIYSMPASAS